MPLTVKIGKKKLALNILYEEMGGQGDWKGKQEHFYHYDMIFMWPFLTASEVLFRKHQKVQGVSNEGKKKVEGVVFKKVESWRVFQILAVK